MLVRLVECYPFVLPYEIIAAVHMYTLLHKVKQKDSIPLVLPTSTPTKLVDHIKFLGVLFDESLTWRNHILVTTKY